MIRPSHTTYHPAAGTSSLLFWMDDEARWVERVEWLRGGICFPAETEINGVRDVQGFALLVGLDTTTGKMTVWEQTPWLVVDSVIDDGRVMFPGLGRWLNRCWSKYYADRFFFHQPAESCKQYRLEIFRSEMVKPKPKMIEISWDDDSAASSIVWKAVKTKRLRFERDSEVHRQLVAAQGSASKSFFPAVHALMCALAGMERYPYRKREVGS